MSYFTPAELEYIASQRLGRLATVAADGAPNNVPVGFKYNPELDTIDIGGYNLGKSKKFRNIQRDERVSFVIDDVLPPWQPRGIEIRGTAETLVMPGKEDDTTMGSQLIRVKPTHIIGWGIDTDAYDRSSRKLTEGK